MYKNRASISHNLGVIALCYFSPLNNTTTTCTTGINVKLQWSIYLDEERYSIERSITLFSIIFKLLPYVILDFCPK